MPWFDAGVNLLDKRFDIDKTIQLALNVGVEKLCVITTHPNEWDAAKRLYKQYPQNIVYTLGVHPHNAKDADNAVLRKLPSLFECDGAVAVGECGLDFNRNFSLPEQQITVFREQLKIARELNMPVYLHERDAFEKQMGCLQEVFSDNNVSGIAHCFTGSAEQLNSYLQKGLYIGITGWLCDPKRGDSLRSAMPTLPLNRLILETDAPYLFPKTVRPRQKNNGPHLLPEIAQEFSRITGHSLTEVEYMSYTNANSLFGLA